MTRPILLRLTFFSILLLLLAPSVPADQHANQSVSQRLDAYLDSLADQGFAGVVLVAHGDKVLLHEGYGPLDAVDGPAMPPDAVFTLGSIAKPFTALAILKLHEQGKLSVDDPIGRFFDDVPADKQGITVHHLLTHSSGWPGALGEDFEYVGRDELVAQAMAAPLLFEPGSRYEYSNVGFSLLAAIIEKLSDKPYAEFLRAAVLEPAGLQETGFDVGLWSANRIAQGYRDGERWGSVVERFGDDGPSWYLLGNGGLHSTAGDMLRLHRALDGDALLSEESKRLAFTRHMPENASGSSHYGYGWAIWDEQGSGEVIAHNGGNMIFFADFQCHVDQDLLVFLATSRKVRGVPDLAAHLARIVLEPGYAPIARDAVSIRTAEPADDDVAGRWGLEDSPLGRVSARFVEALVSEESTRRRLAEEIFTPRLRDKLGVDGLLGLFERLASDLGEFEIGAAERFGARRVELTLVPKGREERFVVGVDLAGEDGAPRIDGLGVEVTM